MWVGSSGGYAERPSRTKVAAAVTLPRPRPHMAEGEAKATSEWGPRAPSVQGLSQSVYRQRKASTVRARSSPDAHRFPAGLCAGCAESHGRVPGLGEMDTMYISWH